MLQRRAATSGLAGPNRKMPNAILSPSIRAGFFPCRQVLHLNSYVSSYVGSFPHVPSVSRGLFARGRLPSGLLIPDAQARQTHQ
jgi:hypothetical protein